MWSMEKLQSYLLEIVNFKNLKIKHFFFILIILFFPKHLKITSKF